MLDEGIAVQIHKLEIEKKERKKRLEQAYLCVEQDDFEGFSERVRNGCLYAV